ncbi:MAG: hypothetical protein MH252_14710 [Thermosynechococcaceae cyanobacterium MS004]|nr:hypothetical protein [Thermosynechococcaceae cyanobacterium MS004]
MQDSPFSIFLAFGFLWILMGVGGLFWLAKSDRQSLSIDPIALLVALPILLAFAVALGIGAIAM